MNREALKLEKFMNFTRLLASLSVCKRLSVGCVICPPDFTSVLAIGYNGPAAGLDNDSCTGIKDSCICVHAEANALIKLGSVQSLAILITTRVPCYHCAGLIVNSKKIKEVRFAEQRSQRSETEQGLCILRGAYIRAIQCDF